MPLVRPSLGTTLLSIVFISASVGFGYWLRGDNASPCLDSGFSFINPLLWCNSDDSNKFFVGEYEEFQAELFSWIESRKKLGAIDEAAVYFRDLSAGPWFGIREDATFVPASLFKLPTMIAVLRAAKEYPEFLSFQVQLSGAYLGLKNVREDELTVQPGKMYTVDELLEKMIVYSDNPAFDLLREALKEVDPSGSAVSKIYQELGMLAARDESKLTVKSYASLFRVLFNSRYLPPELSEKALGLLARSSYAAALKAGVPPQVVVAHKFGIRDVPTEDVKQFHDCGIVYHPGRPYILCIMTISRSVDLANAFIKEVSAKIYQAVDSRVAAEAK